MFCLFSLLSFILPQVDPMFQRMAASFDENSTAGVFLSVLFSEDSRCELLFPSHMTLLHSRSPCSSMPVQYVPARPLTGKPATASIGCYCVCVCFIC